MKTKQSKYLTVDFADQKDVEIISVVIKNIYSGLLAGKRSDFTKAILTGFGQVKRMNHSAYAAQRVKLVTVIVAVLCRAIAETWCGSIVVFA